MDHPDGVGRRQCARQLAGDADDGLHGKWSVAQSVLERAVAHQIHRIPREAGLLIGAMDPHDIGVLEPGQNAGFAVEAFEHGLGRHVRPQHLDGHAAAKAPVHGTVNRRHATGAEPDLDVVVGRQRVMDATE